jgi:plasmid stability protein
MTITLNIGPEIEAALAATADAQGLSAEQYARQVLEQALASAAAPRPPLAARIRRIWADIPDEVRAKLPADGASQHDHYIYGVPKRVE